MNWMIVELEYAELAITVSRAVVKWCYEKESDHMHCSNGKIYEPSTQSEKCTKLNIVEQESIGIVPIADSWYRRAALHAIICTKELALKMFEGEKMGRKIEIASLQVKIEKRRSFGD